ncbi:MAG TPA: Rrf2 family transcriptional regulator [Steroidobacteraceae bacterium]|nr:Rrf2 family transcriptional regulator [Steroidobacteraceae bacterium]
MRLTLRTDYALRALIYLGTQTDSLSTIRQIADAFALPRTHVMKVINDLSRYGYVQTLRGKHGGVRLHAAPASIRVGAVVRDMEDDLAVMGCFAEPGFCRIQRCCVLQQALRAASHAFLATLDSYTLADLLGPRRRLARELGLTEARSAAM